MCTQNCGQILHINILYLFVFIPDSQVSRLMGKNVFRQRNKAHSSATLYLVLQNFFSSRLLRVGRAETSLGKAGKYWPGLRVRDLYSLRQVSALKAIPAPAKHREKFGHCTG